MKLFEKAQPSTLFVPIILGITTAIVGISLTANAQVNHPLSAPRTAEDYFFRGDAMDLGYDPQEKFDAFTQAIKLNPNYAEAYYERGITSLWGIWQSEQKAIEDFTKAIEINPNYAAAYYKRGNTYKQLEDYQKAIEDYTKAIAIDRNFISAYCQRGNVYNQQGNKEEATKDYFQVIQLTPVDSRYSTVYQRAIAKLRRFYQY